MSVGAEVKAWRPALSGVVEVLHAHFPSHAYPSHTHDAWTVLIVDEGAVRYDLDHRDPGVASRLRDVLDEAVPAGITLDEATRLVHAHPAHQVRAFSREYGMPPHRYLTGRRVDLARRYLHDGRPPAEVATLAGFYDQSHLNRHFRRMLGVTPARFVRRRP